MNQVIYAIAGGIKHELKAQKGERSITVDKIDLDIERERVNLYISTGLETTIFAIDVNTIEVWNYNFEEQITTLKVWADVTRVYQYADLILAITAVRDYANNKHSEDLESEREYWKASLNA